MLVDGSGQRSHNQPDLVLLKLYAARQDFVLLQLQHDRVVQVELLQENDLVIQRGRQEDRLDRLGQVT